MTRARVWVVGPKDGTRLGDVLERAGCDGAAVSEGRVFIGRRRAGSAEDVLKVGDAVRFAAREERAPDTAVILMREGGLVAADKPADTVTIPDQTSGHGSLLDVVADAIGVGVKALHPTSRLDRGVSGVVIFAETAEARERLAAARAAGSYARRYVAIAAHAPGALRGEWSAPIGRAKDPRHRAVNGRDAADARSRFAVVGAAGSSVLLALEPITGRTHQLRVHAAHAAASLLGDRVYGGPHRLTLPSGKVLSLDRIALHAARVRVPRPDGSILEVASSVPDELRNWWKALGGQDGAWDLALAGDTLC